MRKPQRHPIDARERGIAPAVAFALCPRAVVALSVQLDGHPLVVVSDVQPIARIAHANDLLTDAAIQTRDAEHAEMSPDLQLALAAGSKYVGEAQQPGSARHADCAVSRGPQFGRLNKPAADGFDRRRALIGYRQ